MNNHQALGGNSQLVDVKELAKIIGMKESWIRRNMKKIPNLRFGRLVRFDPVKVIQECELGAFRK